MSIQILNPERKEILMPTSGVVRLVLFILALLCGLTIFVLGCNYFDIFPTNHNIFYQAIMCAVFLSVAVWFKRDERLNPYWQIACAFFTQLKPPPLAGDPACKGHGGTASSPQAAVVKATASAPSEASLLCHRC
jgi:hypothetical protein